MKNSDMGIHSEFRTDGIWSLCTLAGIVIEQS